jgi:hypothetical protein
MKPHENGYLVPALSLALWAVAFKFGPNGVSWSWADQPVVPVVLAATSAGFWLMFCLSARRRPSA